MKRKEKLDWLRANNPLDATRPDLRTPIWEPRAEPFSEENSTGGGFGPRPQSVAHGRADGHFARRKPSGLGRDTAFRFATDKKETARLRR